MEIFINRLSDQTSDARKYPADDEIIPSLHTDYDEHSVIFRDDSTIIFPDNQAVKAALDGLWIETAGQIRKRLIRYILYRIELMKMSEDKFAEPLIFKDDLTTLEHIMPNEWKKTWQLPVADGAITYETDTRSVYVNRDVDDAKCLYESLFSDPEEPSRSRLAKPSYSDAFNLALARDDLFAKYRKLNTRHERA